MLVRFPEADILGGWVGGGKLGEVGRHCVGCCLVREVLVRAMRSFEGVGDLLEAVGECR